MIETRSQRIERKLDLIIRKLDLLLKSGNSQTSTDQGDIDITVYRAIRERNKLGLAVGKNNTFYGPLQASKMVGITPEEWQNATYRLADRGLIYYDIDTGKRKPSSWRTINQAP